MAKDLTILRIQEPEYINLQEINRYRIIKYSPVKNECQR